MMSQVATDDECAQILILSDNITVSCTQLDLGSGYSC